MSPVLEELSNMPDFLDRAIRRAGEDRSKLPGANGSFSLLEHVWHLADLEEEGFGVRIRRLRCEDAPNLPDFEGDRIARERQYGSRDLEEGMRRFRTARAANLHVLGEVAASEWDRAGVQEGYGLVRLRDLPLRMVEHDRSHRNEIGRLFVLYSVP